MASAKSNHAPAQINRRSLLAALPAIAAVPAVALSGEVLPSMGSPIAEMHREITRRQAFLKGEHGLSDEDSEAYSMETVALADRLVEIPALNTDDMLRKIMGYTINGDHDLAEGEDAQRLFAEARALVAA